MPYANKNVLAMKCFVICVFLFHSLPALEIRSITDAELKELSESLFAEDTNNAGRFISISTQGRTNSESRTDFAPQPLLTIDRRVYEITTIAKLLRLYDNYDPDVRHDEVVTTPEKQEEAAFLNAVLNTTVMAKTKRWLNEKGLAPRENERFKRFLEDLWFTIYSRGKNKMGSSAFEHIFLGELKNNQVSGLHNWIFFSHEEKRNKLNYLGWLKKIDFAGNKGGLIKLHYTWSDTVKPVGTMFIGTSPELEMSLYTICYLVKPNNKCNLSLGGKTFTIQTHIFTQKNVNLIGSAYPGI